MASDRDIDALLDRQAIHDVVLRYCRGIDRMDLDLVRGCYHPDATDDHGDFAGTRDEFVAWVWPLLERYTATMHLVGNQLIELDGDRARSETYGVAWHHGDPPEDHTRNFVSGFRYLDRLERRRGVWRVASRVAIMEWSHVIGADQRYPLRRPMRTGRRDRLDPSYPT